MRVYGGGPFGSARRPMNETSVYRTKSGTVFRVRVGEDGHLSVEVLRDSTWQSGSIGMVGLRIVEGTRQLTQRQVAALSD